MRRGTRKNREDSERLPNLALQPTAWRHYLGLGKPTCVVLCRLISLIALVLIPIQIMPESLYGETSRFTHVKKSVGVIGKPINDPPQGSDKKTSDPIVRGPSIGFEEIRHDCGIVEPRLLKHEFRFKNIGDATLEIQDVKAGCGCTVVPSYTKSVPPGEEGKITVVLNAAAFEGRIEKGAVVTCNDTKHRNTLLVLGATVRVDVKVLPRPSISLMNLRYDSVTNQTLEIRSALPQPLVVDSVESSVSWLVAAIGQATTNSAKIVITTKPPIPMGFQQAIVTAHTNYEKRKQIKIGIMTQVPTTILAVPSMLFFEKQDLKPIEQSVVVARNDGESFHITQVKTDSPQLRSVLRAKQVGRSYDLRVTYVPKNDQTLATGKLEILTDEPSLPKLEIPYLVR